MSRIDEYLDAADAANTRRSYASAIRHFEVEWGGLLPASIDTLAKYLAEHGGVLSLNTLRHRLAALSRWHQEHGFPDPTKHHKIRQVLKGIRALHPAQEKQARPLELEQLQQVTDWLTQAAEHAQRQGHLGDWLRHLRNRALLLLGFWRGFRSDELINLRIEFLDLQPGQGMTFYLPRSKGDRNLEGRRFSCPALVRMCPVDAVDTWLTASALKEGPLFCGISRWGKLSASHLASGSVIPLLRQCLSRAGVPEARAFSSHSLRRGFAQWANQSGWSIHDLMKYVGWRDIKSAIRYLEGVDQELQERMNRQLGQQSEVAMAPIEKTVPQLPPVPAVPLKALEISLQLNPFDGRRGPEKKALREMREICLARFGGIALNEDEGRYRVMMPAISQDALDEQVYDLLDELHRIADARHCFLEAVCRDPESRKHWD